jgi:hypothetical protein
LIPAGVGLITAANTSPGPILDRSWARAGIAVLLVAVIAIAFGARGLGGDAGDDAHAAIETSGRGQTHVEDGYFEGYETVSRTSDLGRTWLKRVTSRRRGGSKRS